MTKTPGAAGPRFTDLGVRVASAIAMTAVAFFAVAQGGAWFAVLLAIAGALMAWELRAMLAVKRGADDALDAALILGGVGIVGAVLITHFSLFRYGLAWLALCLAAHAVMVWAEPRRGGVSLIGLAYIGLACAALEGLREDPKYGFEAVVWVALVVVAADVGGYFAGRLIGGPKLWPRVSPKKTWAGMIGGVVLAMAAGAAFSGMTTGTLVWEVAIVSAVAAMVSQMGDLGESHLKRRCGVKDSSALIPGHGGLLDRFDGLLAAALVGAVATFLRGKSVFVW